MIIRAPNWIGDAVMSLPAIESIHHNFPQSSLAIAAKGWVKDLFLYNSQGAGVITLPQSNDVKTIWTTAQTLKTAKFDTGLLLTNSFSSAFLFYLARIPERWGYGTDGRTVLLTKSVVPPPSRTPRHQVYYYLDLVRGLGLETLEPRLQIPVPPAASAAARQRLNVLGIKEESPLIIISPGASYGPAKRWPASCFSLLATRLQENKGAEILIIGSAEERDIAAAISSAMTREPAVLTGSTSLLELLGLISQATLFISNDTGPMHIANSLGVPVVAIFGPTDPAVTGPFQKPSAYIKKEDVPCWPCSYRSCPYDHRCMTGVSVEQVLAACEELWP